MNQHSRSSATSTSQPLDLIEFEHQLGYRLADGTFIVVCDLRFLKRRERKRERDILQEFLNATPNLREQAKAGLVSFSIQGGCIHCHTTPEGLKASGAGSENRQRVIDNWMRANLTPEQYALQKARQQEGLPSCRL